MLVAELLYGLMLVGALWPMDRVGYVNVVPLIIHVQGIIAWLRGQEAPWAIEDLALNLIFFVPVTLALARDWYLLRGKRGFVLPVCLLGCAKSVMIEVCQAFVPSRIVNIDDVLFNAVGLVLTARLLQCLARPRSGQQGLERAVLDGWEGRPDLRKGMKARFLPRKAHRWSGSRFLCCSSGEAAGGTYPFAMHRPTSGTRSSKRRCGRNKTSQKP